MIVRVTLKAPDCLYEGVRRAIQKQLGLVGGDHDERVSIAEWHERLEEQISIKWMRSGEYLTVDFDIEAGTATVVPNKP